MHALQQYIEPARRRHDSTVRIVAEIAANAGVDLLMTNDRRLRGLVIPGIHFVAGMDVSLF
jgi:hypothetical protein